MMDVIGSARDWWAQIMIRNIPINVIKKTINQKLPNLFSLSFLVIKKNIRKNKLPKLNGISI